MSRRDDYIRSLENLERGRTNLISALDAFGDASRSVCEAVAEGADVANALQELHWVGIRRNLEETWSSFQEALYEVRCVAVGIMIDEEGLSISQIARMRGVSRQLISRLYRDSMNRREGH